MAVTALNVRPLQGVKRRDYQAGGALTVGDSVYIASDGDVEVTDANNATTTKAIGIVVSVADSSGGVTTAVAGDMVTVVVEGPVGGFSGLTPNATQWVSETAGEVTETEPSGAGTFSYAIGYAEAADRLYVQPAMAEVVTNS